MIGILDFGSAGNVQSVANAFKRAGAQAGIVKKYDAAASLQGLVIPGVGSFSVVPQIARALGGKRAAQEIEVPVLCICLGMQAMLEGSEECKSAVGLGLVKGKVKKLRGSARLPQLGWNRVKKGQEDALFDGIKDGEYFYFANSYAAFPKEKQSVVGITEYGTEFVSALRKDNWWGVQFHPEKSGAAGQRMIGNFAGICKRWQKMKQVIPSIDLLGEDAVRLLQGKEGTQTIYGNPLELAAKYEAVGFGMLHVVDLDAAFGRKSQIAMLGELRGVCKRMKIQWAGGIRSLALASEAFAAGADSVVFGTSLFAAEKEVAATVAEFGAGKVWAALDFAGKPPVAKIAGWKKETGIGLEEALQTAENAGVGGIIVSSVDADGMQGGPDLELIAAATRLCSKPIWAAGGMRNARDAKAAFGLGAQGAIFGRALYGKNIDLEELACLQGE